LTDILPAVAAPDSPIDLGFATYIEYIQKFQEAADPVLFVTPAFAFTDGTFISYKDDVPRLDGPTIRAWQSTTVWRWLDFRIGAQRASVFELMLFYLAETHGDNFQRLKIVDTPMDEGLAAAEQGSLDITAIGLTPLAEVQKRGGRPVLSMEDLGFADITGFIVKKSIYDSRRREVLDAIRMWFDCVAHVMADIDRNSVHSRAYLDQYGPKRLTLEEYKRALSQEYFPTSRSEARAQLIDRSGRFSAETIGNVANTYLVRIGKRDQKAKLPPIP
jgi:hypothetical protein